MKEQLARTIIRYRKEKGLTQDELAQKLGLSFQAISKWENAQTMPDITLLPPLAGILGITVDKLLGYASQTEPITIYEEQYRIPEYYWGTEPNSSCYQILQLMPPTRPLKVLDIGCEEGKDAVFLARNGYEVTGFDVTDAGIEKTKRLAERAGVHVSVFKADIRDFRLDTEFDILHSSGVLHYLPAEERADVFAGYQRYTRDGGLHVFNVFVQKPFIASPPENEPFAYPWHSGELLALYRDWLIRDSSEVVFDCSSSGIPHQHAMAKITAQKVGG